MAVRNNPYGQFNFMVKLGDTGGEDQIAGGFADFSGAGNTVKYAEYRNGNDKENHVRKIPNINSTEDVTLKRGIIGDLRLFEWIKATREGVYSPRTVTVTLLDEARTAVCSWTLRQAQPSKWVGPSLSGKGSDVAMEELHLVAERIDFASCEPVAPVSTVGLDLGAPGVYPARAPGTPAYQEVRLDVAGFVGVAPRGPVDQPVPVESWTDYRWRFGGYDGPGLLPWAVRTFFAQGGRRAYVCRVSPLPRWPDPTAGSARATLRVDFGRPDAPAPLLLRAADEGTWGGGLRVTVRFTAGARFAATAGAEGLTFLDDPGLDATTLLRVRRPAPAADVGRLRWVESLGVATDGAVRRVVAALDGPVPDGPVEVEPVTATVEVRDLATDLPRVETFGALRLRGGHPRSLVAVLSHESLLVELPDPDDPTEPDAAPPERLLPADALLEDLVSRTTSPGADRWQAITRDSLFGDLPAELVPVDGPDPDAAPLPGVDAMAVTPEVALVSVPDLFWAGLSAPTATVDPPAPGRPSWVRCRPALPTTYGPAAPVALLLDGWADREEIALRQQRVVALAERQQRFVALLDVPPHLTLRAIARWRAQLDSSYAAAYHPWLAIPGTAAVTAPGVGAAQLVPPSAFAAGIVAEREHRLGLPFGPANELAREAVLAGDLVTDADHDALHALSVDVFRAERDGFRLTAARTLSSDPDYRQLSVRRLMTMLRLMLLRQSQWVVFEPHTAQLRDRLRDCLVSVLRDLYRGGAFAGDSEDDAFFVRCDDAVNPAWSTQLGRLVAEVGVAPASPLEYLVLRLAQDTDGSLRVSG